MINTKLCPLCGEPNECARVKEPEGNGCWCREEQFPSALLERVPEKTRRKACICGNCVKKAARSGA